MISGFRLRFAAICFAAAAWATGLQAWLDGRSPVSAQAPDPQVKTRAVWSGVYTEAQAERGRTAYAESCTYCHREDLSGNEDGAPALRGPAFLEHWLNRPLSEFYFVLSETMPQDAPTTLTPKQYVDIISFILQRNGASASQTELPADMEQLKRIAFTPAPGR